MPTTVASDSFTRANGALGTAPTGQTWAIPTSTATFAIVTNAAMWTGGPANPNWSVAWVDSTVSNCTVTIDLDASANGALIFRGTDDNNYWMYLQSGYIFKKTAGSFSLITGPDLSGAGTYSAVLNGSSITILKNGTTSNSTTDSFNSTATRHGFACAGDVSTVFDNFSVTTPGGLAPPPPGLLSSRLLPYFG